MKLKHYPHLNFKQIMLNRNITAMKHQNSQFSQSLKILPLKYTNYTLSQIIQFTHPPPPPPS